MALWSRAGSWSPARGGDDDDDDDEAKRATAARSTVRTRLLLYLLYQSDANRRAGETETTDGTLEARLMHQEWNTLIKR